MSSQELRSRGSCGRQRQGLHRIFSLRFGEITEPPIVPGEKPRFRDCELAALTGFKQVSPNPFAALSTRVGMFRERLRNLITSIRRQVR